MCYLFLADPNIIPVDISRLDAEIQRLEKELAEKKAVRVYLQQYQVKVPPVIVQPVKHHVPPGYGVSEFILEFLKSGKSETKNITEAYADYIGSSYDDVKGNVSNALSRQKDNGRIDVEYGEGGKRGGGVWFIKK